MEEKMYLSPVGKWKNPNGIKLVIYAIPGRSDDFSTELIHEGINSRCTVHLSRGKDNIFHVYDNEILGLGLLKIASNKEMVIKTSKFDGLILYRDYTKD